MATAKQCVAETKLSYLLPICLVATLGGLLFGYDTGVISGAIESLTQRFQLDTFMKGWASGCVLLGCAAGVLLVGPISDRFGRKTALFISAVLFLLSAVGTSLPNDIRTFIVFRILGGVGIGVASISTPMYIAEITPAHLRGRMVAVNQIAIVGGIAATSFVNYVIAQQGDQAWNIATGWRWMFATGILPAIAFFLLLLRIPESPRWLFEQKRDGEASDILCKVGGKAFAETESSSIRAALADDKGTRYELFSERLRLPLALGIALAVLQQVTGINVFLYFGATIFKTMSQSTGVDAGLAAGQVVHTYLASQAAVSVNLYQSGFPDYFSGYTTPDVMSDYPATTNCYFAGVTNKTVRLFSYYNGSDYALHSSWFASWEVNNQIKPDMNYHYDGPTNAYDTTAQPTPSRFYYDSLIPFDERTLAFTNDTHEIFSYAAESHGAAVGIQPSMNNFTTFNLAAGLLGYTDAHYSHSRQFRSNSIAEKPYWIQLLIDCQCERVLMKGEDE